MTAADTRFLGATFAMRKSGDMRYLENLAQVRKHALLGEPMPVEFFRRNLPHWQPGAVPYFLTYRLAGCIPKSVLDALKRERQRRLQSPIQDDLSPREHKNRIEKIIFAQWDSYLDGSLGRRWLKQPTIAKVIQESLYFFVGERFRLWDYVIMPNHVHVILEPKEEWTQDFDTDLDAFCDDTWNTRGILSPLMKSLKGYTGKKANRILNRRGPFWQRETYNHWIRDEDEFRRIVYYIEKNPERAGLVSQSYDWCYSSAHDRLQYALDFFTPLDSLRPAFIN